MHRLLNLKLSAIWLGRCCELIYYLVLPYIVFFSVLFAASAEEWERATSYHLLLRDFDTACHSICSAIAEHPQSIPLRRQLVVVYAEAGLEHEALEAWSNYRAMNKDCWDDSALIEHVAWCVLKRGISNPAPMTRLTALESAAETRNARTLEFLKSGFADTCALVRAQSCMVAAELRADEYIPFVVKCAEADRSAVVRTMALNCLTLLKVEGIKEMILTRLRRGEVGREEHLAMAKCLAMIDESKPMETFKSLVCSPDYALRTLAAEYAIYTRLLDGVPALWTLASDNRAEVRAAAFQALAVMWPQWKVDAGQLELLRCCAGSHDGMLASSAGWVLALCRPDEGLPVLVKLCGHGNAQTRSGAVAALCSCGKRAVPYLKRLVFSEGITDQYVVLNACLGLLKLRIDIDSVCCRVEKILALTCDRMTKKSVGLLNAVMDGRFGGDEAMPPELCDVAVRLEILQLLSIVKAPCASRMLESFLVSKAWGVSGIASMVLLTEGNEGTVELVKDLLKGSTSPQIRLQAALVLAMWGRCESAADPLHLAYEGAGRETKERILNALGAIGAESSIAFLSEALSEPSSSLRVQAASALLRIIYK